MHIVDIVTIVSAIVLALLGFISGFGKALKNLTKGVGGFIISIFVCAAIGGAILGTDVVGSLVGKLNDFFMSKAEILGKIKLAVIVYYILLFIAVQILRIIVVKCICRLLEGDKKSKSENKLLKAINKILGVAFVPAVAMVFLLVALAVLKLIDDVSFVQDMLMEIDGTVLHTLYVNNPIVLSV